MQLGPYSMKFLKAMVFILKYIFMTQQIKAGVSTDLHCTIFYTTLGNSTAVLWQISVLLLVIIYFTQRSLINLYKLSFL